MPKFSGIVEDSLKCQIFGQFGRNYRMFMNQHPKDEKRDIFLNYFAQSEILTDEYPLFKALLYFNLPYESIIKDLLQPRIIFNYNRETSADDDQSLGKIIEKFEEIRNNQS
jgi:hypothetical protein